MAVEPEMRFASSPRIALEAAALKACIRTKENDTAALTERIAELEAALAQLTERIASGSVTVTTKAAPPKEEKPKTVAPKAPPAPRPVVTGGAQAVWDQTLTYLRKTDPGLFSPLKAGRFMGCEGNVYRLGFQPENDIFCQMLNRPNKKEVIAAALSQTAGQSLVFEAVLEQAGVNQDEVTLEKNIMDALTETFGSDKVTFR